MALLELGRSAGLVSHDVVPEDKDTVGAELAPSHLFAYPVIAGEHFARERITAQRNTALFFPSAQLASYWQANWQQSFQCCPGPTQ